MVNKTSTPATTTAAHRRQAFISAFLSNGGNATQAAIAAGFSARTAKQAGSRLLTHVDVKQAIREATEKAAAEAGLTKEKVLRNLADATSFDPRLLFDARGRLKQPKDWDDATAAVVAGIEFGPAHPRTGKAAVVKVRLLDRNVARDQAMRNLGLFEKDNGQQRSNFAEELIRARARANR